MSIADDFPDAGRCGDPQRGLFRTDRRALWPAVPKTPANYGFSVLCKVIPGREPAIRQYAKTLEDAVRDSPGVLAPLKLHNLRWIMFPIGTDLYFMYQGIFDTDFDKYSDAVPGDRHHHGVRQPGRLP